MITTACRSLTGAWIHHINKTPYPRQTCFMFAEDKGFYRQDLSHTPLSHKPSTSAAHHPDAPALPVSRPHGFCYPSALDKTLDHASNLHKNRQQMGSRTRDKSETLSAGLAACVIVAASAPPCNFGGVAFLLTKRALARHFLWQAVPGSPSGLPVSTIPGLPTLACACHLSLRGRTSLLY